MKTLFAILAISLLPALASAEDLSHATHGLLLSSSCTENVCRRYDIEVSQKFVRLSLAKQEKLMSQFCAALDEGAKQYEDEQTGAEWSIESCSFSYRGRPILYRGDEGQITPEAWYVLALAALR